MFLFIFESIGTSELILIGIIALMFLGPRKMPEMARKIGKIMSEFRGTANEFKETWQREVDFSEEAKSLDLNALEAEPVARVNSGGLTTHTTATTGAPDAPVSPDAPTIKQADPAAFEHLRKPDIAPDETADATGAAPVSTDAVSDKKDWL